jgi:N-acetyl-gamma-glutamyl-phosphate reductase
VPTPIAILGASGYAGGELIRLADAHPELDVVYLGAHRSAGEPLGVLHPQLDDGDRILAPLDPAAVVASGATMAFLALPHGASAEPALALLDAGVRVVDLGSDFRLDSAERYQAAYGAEHPHPDQLGRWAYGIPELFWADIADTDRVAVPGCYPTATILALAPLVAGRLIEPEGIVVNALSGVSGAGRGVSAALQFGAVDESVKAYKVLEHRHQPEMERALEAIGDSPAGVVFTPHLVPMQRGLLSTCYGTVAPGVSTADIGEALHAAYDAASFVEVIGIPPETRWVVGSNRCLISAVVDERSGTLVAMSAIDNLLKGAAGQGVQCANIVLGLPPEMGLPTTGWMP